MGFATLAMALTLAAFFLWWHAHGLRDEQAVMENRWARAKEHTAAQPAVTLPSTQELLHLRDRISAVNRISDAHGTALPQILLKLEKLLPPGVYLINLRHQRRQGITQWVAETENAETMSELLRSLERAGGFQEVLLTRQGQRTDKQQGVQFEVRLKE